MKTSELTGALLDYWVARAEGWAIKPAAPYNGMLYAKPEMPDEWRWLDMFQPSTCWAQGGPIIERDLIYLDPPETVHYNGGANHGWKRHDLWRATVSARTRTLPPRNEAQEALGIRGVGRGAGETPLVAAMRAYVASKFGDEVPDDLSESSPVGADKEPT